MDLLPSTVMIFQLKLKLKMGQLFLKTISCVCDILRAMELNKLEEIRKPLFLHTAFAAMTLGNGFAARTEEQREVER